MELQWNAEENAGVRRHVQQSVVQRSTKLIQEVKSKKLKEKLEEKKKKQHLRTGEKTQETWEAKCRNNRWHKKSHPSDKRAPGTVPEKEEKTLPLFQEEEPSCFLLHLSYHLSLSTPSSSSHFFLFHPHPPTSPGSWLSLPQPGSFGVFFPV